MNPFHSFSRSSAIILCSYYLIMTPYSVWAQSPESFSPLVVAEEERLLILAPHPDDETLGAGGLAQQVLDQHGSVKSVVITAGDAYVEAIEQELHKKEKDLKPMDYTNYGEKRLNESINAAKLLGKGLINVDLFGFSDGAIYPMLVSNWRPNDPFKSYFTKLDRVPYAESDAPKTFQVGEEMMNRIVDILKATKPTLISFPDVMESDSDHSALGMFTLLAVHKWLAEDKTQIVKPRLLAYIIHWKNKWPATAYTSHPVDVSDKPFAFPEDLPNRGFKRTCLELSLEKRNLKRAALAQYVTQQKVMGPFLASFVNSNECFSEIQIDETLAVENIHKKWIRGQKLFGDNPLSRLNVINAAIPIAK